MPPRILLGQARGQLRYVERPVFRGTQCPEWVDLRRRKPARCGRPSYISNNPAFRKPRMQ